MGEPTFSVRSYIKWQHEPLFNEPTSTWVLTAANGEFVDTRVILDTNSKSKNWFFAGSEKEIETKDGYLYSILFVATLNNCSDDNKQSEDVGNFKKLDATSLEFKMSFSERDLNTLDFEHHRLEEGFMANPDFNNQIEDYQEIWNTIDPINSDPSRLLSLKKQHPKINSKVYKSYNSNGEEVGRYVTVGKFGIGMCKFQKNDFVAVRTFENKCVYESQQGAFDLFNCHVNGAQWKLTYED
ncbi:uncharacterized protein HGUI_00691 [Hanseniaspora guilliermondii]|uniref:Protein HRI1 n=1 Tax=Hanseniaspora guilliermondii TaxID=56406 RepID=A0A1L0B0K2_9ASCO|nr:uncharacterized protein HGUI_00691 [Hanseniaspora guilliermondii]